MINKFVADRNKTNLATTKKKKLRTIIVVQKRVFGCGVK
jgi:hypothetical protein